MLGQPAPPPPPAVYTKVDQLPELASASASGSKSIVEYVQKHVQYPKAAPDLSAGGTVFASFIVTSKGEVQAVAITLHSAPAYEAAVLAAIAQLPALVPGRDKGKAVDVALTMPVYFVKMAPTVPK